jgi:hypothetical protein
MLPMEKHRLISRIACAAALAASLGCRTTVVLVPSGDPVMLAKPTKASIYSFDKNQKLVGPSTVIIPAGWYALPK